MPTYDYQCESCGTTVEVFHRIEEPAPATCEACGAEGGMRKLISPGSGLIFRGSGFYITDYKNKRPAGKEKDNSQAKESEGKAPKAKKEKTGGADAGSKPDS
jgi:putative FmdB family regulatory protein